MNKEKAKQLIDDADIYAVITGKKEDDKVLTNGIWKSYEKEDLENLLCSFIASIIQSVGFILSRQLIVDAVNKAFANYENVQESEIGWTNSIN